MARMALLACVTTVKAQAAIESRVKWRPQFGQHSRHWRPDADSHCQGCMTALWQQDFGKTAMGAFLKPACSTSWWFTVI